MEPQTTSTETKDTSITPVCIRCGVEMRRPRNEFEADFIRHEAMLELIRDYVSDSEYEFRSDFAELEPRIKIFSESDFEFDSEPDFKFESEPEIKVGGLKYMVDRLKIAFEAEFEDVEDISNTFNELELKSEPERSKILTQVRCDVWRMEWLRINPDAEFEFESQPETKLTAAELKPRIAKLLSDCKSDLEDLEKLSNKLFKIELKPKAVRNRILEKVRSILEDLEERIPEVEF